MQDPALDPTNPIRVGVHMLCAGGCAAPRKAVGRACSLDPTGRAALEAHARTGALDLAKKEWTTRGSDGSSHQPRIDATCMQVELTSVRARRVYHPAYTFSYDEGGRRFSGSADGVSGKVSSERPYRSLLSLFSG